MIKLFLIFNLFCFIFFYWFFVVVPSLFNFVTLSLSCSYFIITFRSLLFILYFTCVIEFHHLLVFLLLFELIFSILPRPRLQRTCGQRFASICTILSYMRAHALARLTSHARAIGIHWRARKHKRHHGRMHPGYRLNLFRTRPWILELLCHIFSSINRNVVTNSLRRTKGSVYIIYIINIYIYIFFVLSLYNRNVWIFN